MLDYFAPKTRYVTLDSGVGSHATNRRGVFTVPHVNNQYNDHLYWAYTGVDSSLQSKTMVYCCGLYNHRKSELGDIDFENNAVNFKKTGFQTEQEAANALDAFACQLASHFLQKHLQKLDDERQQVIKLLNGMPSEVLASDLES